jgi:hypothetical protein
VPVAPLFAQELVERRVRVPARDVVYVRGLLEANEGLGALLADADGGGDLCIVAHASRALELDEWLRDLADEVTLEATVPVATRAPIL